MEKRVSKFWNIEKNEGYLIIHDKGTVYEQFRSPASNLNDFEEWVDEQTRILRALKNG